MSREKLSTQALDAKVAKIVADEMHGVMTLEDTEKFVGRLGRLVASIELISPAMIQLEKELRIRRRIVEAAIRRENPSRVRSAVSTIVGVARVGVKGAVSIAAGVTSSVVNLFKRKTRADLPPEEWSLPMLKAEVERQKAAAANA